MSRQQEIAAAFKSLRSVTGVALMFGLAKATVYSYLWFERQGTTRRGPRAPEPTQVEREVRGGVRCPGPCWLLRDRPHVCTAKGRSA